MISWVFMASLPTSLQAGLALNQPLVAGLCRLLVGLAALLVLRALARRQLAFNRAAAQVDPFLAGPTLRTASQLGLVLVVDWSWAALPAAPQANQIVQAVSGLVALLLVVRLINGGLERLLAVAASRLGEAGEGDRLSALLPPACTFTRTAR